MLIVSPATKILDEGANIVHEAATKPLGAISNTFVSAWNLTFGNIDHWNEKSKIKREANLKEYSELSFMKFNGIPETNRQEPKMSIVGPAVEASKYFFEEEYYREMFSNLIAGTFDNRKDKLIHESFTELIKQLSPLDARILNFINNHSPDHSSNYPLCKVLFKGAEENTYEDSILNNYLFMNLPFIDSQIDDSVITSSLNNLSRLGLVTINVELTGMFNTDKTLYNYCTEEIIKMKFKIDHQSDKIVIVPGVLLITKYGSNFISVCLPSKK